MKINTTNPAINLTFVKLIMFTFVETVSDIYCTHVPNVVVRYEVSWHDVIPLCDGPKLK